MASPRAARLGPGTLVGGYRIERRLGEGGMGCVYVARQLSLDRDVALKLLHPDLLANGQQRARFLQEGRLTAQVRHANLVPIVDIGEEAGRLYIAYELIRGATLRDRLDRGPLDIDATLEVAAACAEGLEALHGKDVLHRDLKPENIFLSIERGVLLGDLGLAKVQHDDSIATREGVVLGTPSYLAPELIQGRPYTAASDLYALGVTLYECLAGEPPFRGDDLVQMLAEAMKGAIPRLSERRNDVPGELERAILRLLHRDARERFPGARAFREALGRLPVGRTVDLTDAARRARIAARSSQTHKAARSSAVRPAAVPTLRMNPVWMVGAVVGLVTMGGVWWMVRPGPAQRPTPPRAGAADVVLPGAKKAPIVDSVGEAFKAVDAARVQCEKIRARPELEAGRRADDSGRRMVLHWKQVSVPLALGISTVAAELGAGKTVAIDTASRLLLGFQDAAQDTIETLTALRDHHAKRPASAQEALGLAFSAIGAVHGAIAESAAALVEKLSPLSRQISEPRFNAVFASLMMQSVLAVPRTGAARDLAERALAKAKPAFSRLLSTRAPRPGDHRFALYALAIVEPMGQLDAVRPVARLAASAPEGAFDPERTLLRFCADAALIDRPTIEDRIHATYIPRMNLAIDSWDRARRRLLARWPHDPRKRGHAAQTQATTPEQDRSVVVLLDDTRRRIELLCGALERKVPAEP